MDFLGEQGINEWALRKEQILGEQGIPIDYFSSMVI